MSNHCEFVDLSRLIEAPKCAVFFQTVEEVECFYHNCEKQLGDYCLFWALEDLVDRWENDNSAGFTFMTGSEPEDMTWSTRDWFEEEGYEIIEFYDLINPVEIEESEMSLDVLLSQDSASTLS